MKRAPRVPPWIVRTLVPHDLAERIVADLDEEWEDRVRTCRGRWRAPVWYWGMAVRSVIDVWRSQQPLNDSH